MKSSNVFDDVLYAQCWEDPELDRTAFHIAPGDTVFTITSGGCNALAFLIDKPGLVIATDLNGSQNHLTELKTAAYRDLNYGELLEMMGVRPSSHRPDIYQALRSSLSDSAVAYWDQQPQKLQQGLIHCGRYERYMGLCRTWAQRVMGRTLIDRFFDEDDPQRRAELFATKWDNRMWKLLTRILLSRQTMTLLFDGAFFKYVDGDFSFGQHFAARVKFAMTVLPPKENPFLSYILLGRYYSEDHLPAYLLARHHADIQRGLDTLRLQTASCDECFRALPDSTIDHFNFTNIFEWMAPDAYESLLRETHRVGRPGATLTYRNLLVRRERPESLANLFGSDRQLALQLHNRDRSFVYRNYVVEKVIKPAEARS
jgi:S-adenosylmethionine-diacylglycerol 3-amino-3-carboxypropyl transferase